MILKIGGEIIKSWKVTAPFGALDSSHLTPHKGIDYAVNVGTPIPAINDGVVTAVTDEGTKSFGKAIHVVMKDGNEAVYAHLSETKVKVGRLVHDGDIIALSGNSGASDGAHLHLQIMRDGEPIDPANYLQGNALDSIKDFFERGQYHASEYGHLQHDGVDWWVRLMWWLGDKFMDFVHLLNQHSSEIITVTIMLCGACIMISPLVGLDSAKWKGRAFGSLWLGVIWRLMI